MFKWLLASLLMVCPCLAQDSKPVEDPQAEHAAQEAAKTPAPVATPEPSKPTFPFSPLARAEVVGTGPRTMILIPDVRYPGDVYRPFMERNKERYTMHALTPPGYGGTPEPAPKPEGEFGAWEANGVEALARYIQEKGLQKPVVVGQGMGGRLATLLALEHPDLVDALVVLNTQFFWQPPTIQDPTPEQRHEFIIKEMLPRMKRIPQQEWERRKKLNMPQVCIDKTRSAALEAMAMAATRSAEDGYVLDFVARDLRPDLAHLSTPTLLIEANGLNDAPKDFRDRQESLGRTHAAMIPKGKMVLFRQTRHFAFDDRPEEFVQAIETFLKGEQPADLDPPLEKFDNVPTMPAPPPPGRADPDTPKGPLLPPSEPATAPK